MQDELRRKHLSELVASLAVLSGSAFERFCYRFIEGYAPRDWEHRGTNLAGAPVSHIVDSVAEGGRSVAQYSSEAGYFSGDMKKVNDDLEMSKTNHDNVTELFLVSTRTAAESAKTRTKQIEAQYLEDGIELHIVDAQSVAEYIIENLHNDSWISSLAEHLPILAKWRAEWALTNAIPKYARYVTRPADEVALNARLRDEKFVRVKAVSGMGKSAICSAIATSLTNRFYSVLWVQASSIQRVEQLSEFPVERSGASVNLLGLLQTRPCLLVLDDLRVDLPLDQLLLGVHSDSRVLASSQQGRADAYLLGTVDELTARKIFENNAQRSCPDHVWAVVWRSVGGYPLLLELLGRSGKDGNWPEVISDCSDAVQLDDEQYQKVCNRILERHQTTLRRELAFLRWLDANVVDPLVLQTGASKLAMKHLEARGLLIPSGDELIRIHDLVLASIREVISEPDEPTEHKFIKDLDRFFATVSDDSDLMRERAARLHRPLLRRLMIEGKAQAGVRYAYALVDKSAAEFELLRSAEQLQRQIEAVTDTRSMPEIYAAVEEMEVHYVLKRSRHLATFLPVIESLNARALAIPEAARFIKHHCGKFYLWLDNYDKAAAIFDDLLQTHPRFAEARLQRAVVHVRKKEIDFALERCDEILQQQRTSGSVTMTVMLAIFQLIARHAKSKTAEYVTQYRTELRTALQAGIATRHPQALDALAVLAKALSYNSPELLMEVVRDVADWPATTNREQFSWAQTLKELGKAKVRSDPAEGMKLFEAAAEWYEKTHVARDYEAHQIAEGFILVQRPEKALRVLKGSQPDADRADYSPFWFYRMSQAQRLLEQYAGALTSIDRALELLEERDPSRGAFLEQRFLVRSALKDSAAEEDLRAAIELASGGYKAKLERQLSLSKRSD